MSKKHFSWLLAITLIVTLVILFTPGKTSRESAFEVRPLVPGLDARVNEIDRVRIVAAGNRTVATLLRNERGWVVEESGSYPADWARLKSLMAALAQAEVIEPKTANPEYFERLGLSDVGEESSTAIKVELGQSKSEAGGEAGGLVSVLVGNAAPQQEGQYVRVNDEPQAFLINRTLEVPGESNAWLEREIIDVSDAEVVEVNITHPDGESVTLLKPSADVQDFTLQGLPEGREIASAWSVNSLGGSLAGLELEEVRADSGLDWGQAIHLRVLTADGVEVKAQLVEAEEKHWLKLSAAAYPQANAGAEAQAEAGSASEGSAQAEALETLADAMKESAENVKEGVAQAGSDAAADGDAQVAANADAGEEASQAVKASAADELAQRVAAINQRVSGWAYAIPAYKAEGMRKRLEDLLKPVEES